MPTSGPLAFSMMMTAGTSAVLTAADFAAGTPYYARISNIAYISKVTIDYDYSAAGPHFLVLSPDRAKTAIATPTAQPLWVHPVWPNNQAAAASTYPRIPGEILFLQPLLAGSQLDLYFQTARWPDATTFFKPSALNISVEYSPFNRVV
jgi:hypothetical protein